MPDASPGGAGTDGGGGDAARDAPGSDAAASDAPNDAPPACVGADAGIAVATGACAEIIATGQGEALHVRVIGDKVYWSTFGGDGVGRIMRASLDGSGAHAFYAAPGVRPKFIAAHGNVVFWGEQTNATETDSPGAVRMKAIDDTEVVTLTESTYAVRGIGADDQHVYWSAWGGNVRRIQRDGGDLVDLQAGQVELIDLAVDSEGYVFTASGNDSTNPGYVVAQNKTAVSSWQSPTAGTFPWGARLDGTNVYWTERGWLDGGSPGGVFRADRADGGNPLELCTATQRPLFLAVDAKYVWFTEDNSGSPTATLGARGNVSRVPKDGGACEVRVSGSRNVHGIATGGGYVFWTTRDGEVWRMPSP